MFLEPSFLLPLYEFALLGETDYFRTEFTICGISMAI